MPIFCIAICSSALTPPSVLVSSIFATDDIRWDHAFVCLCQTLQPATKLLKTIDYPRCRASRVQMLAGEGVGYMDALVEMTRESPPHPDPAKPPPVQDMDFACKLLLQFTFRNKGQLWDWAEDSDGESKQIGSIIVPNQVPLRPVPISAPRRR